MAQNYLVKAAQRFSLAVTAGGGKSILIGGAACMLLGSDRRTKDLDFDLTSFSDKIKTELLNAGVSSMDVRVPHRFRATVPLSTEASVPQSPKKRSDVKVDIAVKDNVENLLRHTKIIEGIVVASESLILVKKIESTIGRRSAEKLNNDIDDIVFCTLSLARKEETVPSELLVSLSPGTILSFWKIVKESIDEESHSFIILREFLPKIGIDIKESNDI